MKHTDTGHAGAGHGSVRDYLIGFVLSVILTVIPFGMVMNGTYDPTIVLYTVVIAAVVQIVVHLIYFLHMNGSSEQSWNRTAMVFTLLIIGIVVVGSLWIMNHLNHNMMGL
jgi:cytochrome o ubiquinol oxidase subunit IV